MMGKRAKRSILSAAVVLLLLAVWMAVRTPAVDAAGLNSRSAQAQTTGQPFTLPLAWDGPDMLMLSESTPVDLLIPGLEVEVEGDFQVMRVTSPEGDTIRILAQPSGQPGVQPSLTLAWQLPDPEQAAPLLAGQVLSLSAAARLYSPPDGVQLTIGEAQAGAWGSSSVTMDGVSWTDYAVTRALAPDADQVQVGITWRPAIENAWLELRDLAVTVAATAGPDELSATDTPTPIPVPTSTPTPEPPSPTPTPVVAPEEAEEAVAALVIVTSTPTPVDVFEEATRVALATEQAASAGPATPTPENQVTATPTPTPIVVTNTPTPANLVTATYVAALATARAFTTGTPTPYPPELAVLLATDTPTPAPTVVPLRATNTPTPIFRYVEEITTAVPTATPVFPAELQGKILFLSDMFGTTARPNAFMINPDGTGLALLTGREFHTRAKARDAYSADKRFYAFAQRADGPGKGGLVQVFYNDAEYGSTDQLTFFGAGTAWAPVWSPRDQSVALVSNESRNDEIWLVRPNEWPPRKLTENDWEWDKSPSFSPDSSQIVFESNRVSGVRQLWLVDAGGGEPRQFTFLDGFEAWEPVWVKYLDD